ncbi:MAG: helix-turn-helix domain-containing protein [bacterium]|nr:helix-turn-helix domain-containing protein [bacterium]
MFTHAQTMSYDNENNFLTVQEVSNLLQLSALTIYKYIKTGKLSAIQFGGHYRISKDFLDAFITSHKVPKGCKEYSQDQIK